MDPTGDFQGNKDSGMDAWATYPSQAYGNRTYPGPHVSRRNSNDEVPLAVTLAARSDYRYNLPKQADDMYHCPFEATEECSHKPEKLKCNYE